MTRRCYHSRIEERRIKERREQEAEEEEEGVGEELEERTRIRTIRRKKTHSPATSSAVPNLFKGMKGRSFSVSRSLVMSDSMNPEGAFFK